MIQSSILDIWTWRAFKISLGSWTVGNGFGPQNAYVGWRFSFRSHQHIQMVTEAVGVDMITLVSRIYWTQHSTKWHERGKRGRGFSQITPARIPSHNPGLIKLTYCLPLLLLALITLCYTCWLIYFLPGIVSSLQVGTMASHLFTPSPQQCLGCSICV